MTLSVWMVMCIDALFLCQKKSKSPGYRRNKSRRSFSFLWLIGRKSTHGYLSSAQKKQGE